METTFDLAFVIGRCILLFGCAYCAYLARHTYRVRSLAMLGVVIMVVGLVLGIVTTAFVPTPLTAAPRGTVGFHATWQAWSTLIFGVGVLDYLIAIIFGDRFRRQAEASEAKLL